MSNLDVIAVLFVKFSVDHLLSKDDFSFCQLPLVSYETLEQSHMVSTAATALQLSTLCKQVRPSMAIIANYLSSPQEFSFPQVQ